MIRCIQKDNICSFVMDVLWEVTALFPMMWTSLCGRGKIEENCRRGGRIVTFQDIMNFYGENEEIFREMQENFEHIIPFVGAGLSCDYGYPLWGSFLG